MNVLELLLGQLSQEKNLLEAELERVINNKDLTITEKVDLSKKLIQQISNTLMSINLTNGYISPLKQKEDNNN